MSKYLLAAGVAALAFATPGVAQKHGGGHGGGQAQEHGQSGKGQGHANKGQGQVNKGQGHAKAPAMKGHGGGKPMQQQHASKGHGPDVKAKAQGHADRGMPKSAKTDRMNGPGSARPMDVRGYDGQAFPRLAGGGMGLVNGCPPGLAMKNNGCTPPGQFKKVGQTLAASALPALAGPYSQWYRDSDRYYYRMGDGVVYQVNRSNNLIDALIPYGMRDYSYYPVGYTYPSLYNSYNVPTAYQGFYPNGGDYLYRYGGNAIYAVDPTTQAVQSIVSLLAGDLAVGQRLPSNYNVYNVPLSYRDQYHDTPNAWYRYNDGYIYQVDPSTQLISAVINALV